MKKIRTSTLNNTLFIIPRADITGNHHRLLRQTGIRPSDVRICNANDIFELDSSLQLQPRFIFIFSEGKNMDKTLFSWILGDVQRQIKKLKLRATIFVYGDYANEQPPLSFGYTYITLPEIKRLLYPMTRRRRFALQAKMLWKKIVFRDAA